MDWVDPILQLCREGATLIPALDPYGGFLKWGTPNGWFISGKIPSRNGWFRATPIYGTPQIWKRFLCRLEDRKTLNPRLEVEHWPSQIGQILRPRSLGAAHIRRQFLVSRVSFWRQENMDAFRVLGSSALTFAMATCNQFDCEWLRWLEMVFSTVTNAPCNVHFEPAKNALWWSSIGFWKTCGLRFCASHLELLQQR